MAKKSLVILITEEHFKLLQKYNACDLEELVEDTWRWDYTNGGKKYYLIQDWTQYLESIEGFLKRIEEDSSVFWVNDEVRALTKILSDAHFILTESDVTSSLDLYFEKYNKKTRKKKLEKINENTMGRPKISKKKIVISLTINEELDQLLDKVVDEKKLSKSQYIEDLIKKDIKKSGAIRKT